MIKQSFDRGFHLYFDRDTKLDALGDDSESIFHPATPLYYLTGG